MLLLLAFLEKSRVGGKEEEKGRASLTSCSESPSMISDTSCSLRAADMESPPLPLCPTLLGKGKEHSETGALLGAVLHTKHPPCPSFLTCAISHLLHGYHGTFHTQPGPPTVFSRAHFIAPQHSTKVPVPGPSNQHCAAVSGLQMLQEIKVSQQHLPPILDHPT